MGLDLSHATHGWHLARCCRVSAGWKCGQAPDLPHGLALNPISFRQRGPKKGRDRMRLLPPLSLFFFFFSYLVPAECSCHRARHAP